MLTLLAMQDGPFTKKTWPYFESEKKGNFRLKDIDLNAKDIHGRTPFMIACIN